MEIKSKMIRDLVEQYPKLWQDEDFLADMGLYSGNDITATEVVRAAKERMKKDKDEV